MYADAPDTHGSLSVEHLSPEAVAALVDGELSPKAEHRAKVHIVHCRECRSDVKRQREAAARLRGDTGIHASGNLIERLTRIPEAEPASASHGRFREDGCRRPETLIDGVDLLLRKIQRRRR